MYRLRSDFDNHTPNIEYKNWANLELIEALLQQYYLLNMNTSLPLIMLALTDLWGQKEKPRKLVCWRAS
jgi:hypothetical protein